MKEKKKNIFFDMSSFSETTAINERAEIKYLEAELRKRIIREKFSVKKVKLVKSGRYFGQLCVLKNLPVFYEIIIEHFTGKHKETITVWSPVKWNDRFIGTAGGGTATGGKQYITKPDNTSRGMTLPKAIINGFTAATTDGGNPERIWAPDKKENKTDKERIENWRSDATHFMTLIGKAVAEIIHNREVKFSYLHGGSGGGRQCMVEAQEHPDDYNGIWASCPAINWSKFVLCGLWPVAVMNDEKHILLPEKIKFLTKAAQESNKKTSFFETTDRLNFDALTMVGTNGITQKDAIVMNRLWRGAESETGEFLWYGFRPGGTFWNVGIPIGAFYYSLIRKKPKPFFLSVVFARWVTENRKDKFKDITVKEFEALFKKSVEKFENALADKPDLSEFYKYDGKLIIDHGTDDPLIPVDGTLDYYNKVVGLMGKDIADKFIRLYITPADGHGSCNWHGPGITQTEGMKALMKWVENGEMPYELRTVQVDKKGEMICEKAVKPYCLGSVKLK